MTAQHPITARCWFCASDDDIARHKAGTPTRRPFLRLSPAEACPFLDEDEQLRPRPAALPHAPATSPATRPARTGDAGLTCEETP